MSDIQLHRSARPGRVFNLIALILLVFRASAAELVYDNAIYASKIQSVVLSTNGDTYNPVPIAFLGGTNSLKLEFDYLEAEQEFYQYSFVHCTSNWEPSNLQVSEYLEGNTMGELRGYTFSTNTLQQYVKYTLTFPSAGMRLIKSGNYLLKVFRNFDEEDLVLTRRFMVLDNRTRVSGEVKPATLPKYRFQRQEVDFEVNYENYTIPNPFTDVSAVILQNYNWSTAKFNLKPLFVNSNNLVFNYEEENVFEGTNEFRFFDTRSLRFFSNQVIDKFTDTLVHAVLRGDEPQAHLAYSFQKDFNGKRVLDNKDGSEGQNDLDYAVIHFTLKTGNPMKTGDVYVFGELSDWQTKPEFKMHYLPDKGYYVLSRKLKQGYYNYQYVVAEEPGARPDYDFTEGNHFQTENDYLILLYHHNLYYDYDELVGMLQLNSSDIRR